MILFMVIVFCFPLLSQAAQEVLHGGGGTLREIERVRITAAGGATQIYTGETLQYSAEVSNSSSGNDWVPVSASEVSWDVLVNGDQPEDLVSIDEQGLATGIAAGDVEIIGIYEGEGGTQALTVIKDVLESIEITIEIQELPVGSTSQVTAMGTFISGTKPITDVDHLLWRSSKAETVSVTSTGVVEALVENDSAIITAELDLVQSNPITITTNDAILAALTIRSEHGVTEVAVGLTESYVAEGHYSDGNDYPLLVGPTWRSDTPDKATIDSASGELTGVGEGSTNVTATMADANGDNIESAPLEVIIIPAVLQGIRIEPVLEGGDLTVVGTSTEFSVIAEYSDGDITLNSGDVYWGAGIGSTDMTADGVITPEQACLENNCSIYAEYEGKNATAYYTAVDLKSPIHLDARSKDFLGWKVVLSATQQQVVGFYGTEYGLTSLDFTELVDTWGLIDDVSPLPAIDITGDFKLAVMNQAELSEVYTLAGDTFNSWSEGFPTTDIDQKGVWTRTEVNTNTHIVLPGDLEGDELETHYVMVILTKAS